MTKLFPSEAKKDFIGVLFSLDGEIKLVMPFEFHEIFEFWIFEFTQCADTEQS